MKRFILLAGLGLSALLAIPAMAADRSVRGQEWPAYSAPRPYNWNGVYAGVHTGGAFDRFQGTGKKSRNEILLGGQVGYNLQMGGLVTGVEADVSMNGLGKGAKRTGGTSADMRYVSTLKARAGIAFDRVLVYGLGGVAYGSLKASNGLVSKEKSKVGYVVGAGAEYGITDNLSAKLEYNYVSLGKQNFQLANGRTRVGVNEHLVKAGLNYRF
ncbi:outer membrane protein [Bosea sp. (in: a-proteobacteria)]|jgi:outer membrane immunogenic protein|uniref:outer membrane protein n=1 Tax=Bosea sp. (in: a-proteobacteria) TaxID=1871050 RepID=UPI002DDCF722|nr:outer membrane protein [Bosea sp. (in: a-proteobacteria)]HEV2508224.1 outer membrane protein [Bosea sp. (in: a-proteobacteria)]